MMKRLALVLALALAAQAQAQVTASNTGRSWDNYCTLDPFQACMSVEVSLVPRPDSLTSATVSIRNLQGTLGTNEAWGFQGLSISNLLPSPTRGESPSASGVAPTFSGTASNVNVSADRLSSLWEYGYYSTAGFIDRTTQIGDGDYAIAGCSGLVSDLFGLYHYEQGYFSTCGEGWVTYHWLVQPVAFSDNITVRMTGYHLSAAGTVQPIGCTFGDGCVSMTPEPATILLVATGLAFIAFTMRRSISRLR